MANAMIFENLAKPVRDSIEDFQRYVVSEYQRGAGTWRQAQALVHAIARQFGRDLKRGNCPVDPQEVAHKLSVEISFMPRTENSVCGRLVPTENGFRAVVAGAPGEPRARFSVAHECGHVLFYYPSPRRPERIIPKSFEAESRIARKEEGLCDDFARVLLLPEESIADLTRADVSLEHLLTTASRQRVSPETLVRRVLYDLDRWDTSVLYCIRWRNRSFKVQTYRGLRRRTNSDRAPSAKVMRDVFQQIPTAWSVEAVKTHLRDHFGLADCQIQPHHTAIWVSM